MVSRSFARSRLVSNIPAIFCSNSSSNVNFSKAFISSCSSPSANAFLVNTISFIFCSISSCLSTLAVTAFWASLSAREPAACPTTSFVSFICVFNCRSADFCALCLNSSINSISFRRRSRVLVWASDKPPPSLTTSSASACFSKASSVFCAPDFGEIVF